jgi:hypothetical protein
MSFQPLSTREVQDLVELSDHKGPIKQLALSYEALLRAYENLPRVAPITGKTSDGYHTFNELYDHRVTLFMALCAAINGENGYGIVWRSEFHSDGSKFDGWFVLGIGTKPGEQMTYHLPMNQWENCKTFSLELERAPAFDGHMSADVLKRLRKCFGIEIQGSGE